MREGILHIGTEKTGTQTIRHFLSKNTDVLKQKSIFFPFSLEKNSQKLSLNRSLAFICMNDGKFDDMTTKFKIDTLEKRNDLKHEYLTIIKKILNNYPANSKIIFSSEHLQSRLTSIHEINSLKKLLFKFKIENFKVIVYLRNPIDAAVSLFSTLIKGGQKLYQILNPDAEHIEIICSHKNTLEKWSKVFGESNVIPRLYIKDELYKKSIIDDFIFSAKLPKLDYIYPENKNVALSNIGKEIVLNANKKISKFLDKEINPSRGKFIKAVEKYFSSFDKIEPSNDLIEKYENYYYKSNETVRKKYFPNKKILFPKPEVTDNQEITLKRSMEILSDSFCNLWLEKNNDMEDLEKRIKAQKDINEKFMDRIENFKKIEMKKKSQIENLNERRIFLNDININLKKRIETLKNSNFNLQKQNKLLTKRNKILLNKIENFEK